MAYRHLILTDLILGALLLKVDCVSFINSDKYVPSLQVKTQNGIVQGREGTMENGRSFFLYQGIPFAQPPLYNLRFMSPQPIPKWPGVLDATKEGPSCIEVLLRMTGMTTTGSEDCLYLNVYSPISPRSQEDLLPVIFWIYGGGFLEGNSNLSFYGPERLLAQDLVVVTSNYRLGMFGFLSTEDDASPGNYGLKDQNAALRWVASNIQNFGGDPDKITISGHSAGACSVIYHLLSPMSRGLFRGAIAMSGDTLSTFCSQRSPRNVADSISMSLGIDMTNTTEFIETLRSMDSDVLKYGQMKPVLVNIIQVLHNGLMFTPVIEHDHKGAFVTEASYNLLEKGEFSKVPLVVGITSLEMNIFAAVIPLLRPALLYFDLSPSSVPTRMHLPSFARRRAVGNLIRERYFGTTAISTASLPQLLQYLSDVFFVRSVHKSIRFISKYVPVYFYVFTYEGEVAKTIDLFGFSPNKKAKGTSHGDDVPYIWTTMYGNITVEKDKLVSNRVTKLWSNFARFGNPTPAVDPLLQNVTWPSITDERNINYLQIGEDLSVLCNYRSDYIQFWNRLYEKYAQKPFDTY